MVGKRKTKSVKEESSIEIPPTKSKENSIHYKSISITKKTIKQICKQGSTTFSKEIPFDKIDSISIGTKSFPWLFGLGASFIIAGIIFYVFFEDLFFIGAAVLGVITIVLGFLIKQKFITIKSVTETITERGAGDTSKIYDHIQENCLK